MEASGAREVITAIRSAEQEAQITKSLNNLGWKILFRATSLANLIEQVTANPDACLISSDDFNTHAVTIARHIRVKGAAGKSTARGGISISSQEELEDALNQTLPNNLQRSESIPTTVIPIIALISIGRNIGVTSLAISIAAELKENGSEVLLVDGHHLNPTLARHFKINGIRNEVKRTSDGLEIYEAVSLPSMKALPEISQGLDFLILDLGEVLDIGAAINGRRRSDLLLTWAIKSKAHCIFVTSDDQFFMSRADEIVSDGSSILRENKVSRATILRRQLSKSEVAEVLRRINPALHSATISYEPRALSKMVQEGSTLISAAPRSIYRRDVQRLIKSAS